MRSERRSPLDGGSCDGGSGRLLGTATLSADEFDAALRRAEAEVEGQWCVTTPRERLGPQGPDGLPVILRRLGEGK